MLPLHYAHAYQRVGLCIHFRSLFWSAKALFTYAKALFTYAKAKAKAKAKALFTYAKQGNIFFYIMKVFSGSVKQGCFSEKLEYLPII